MAQVIGDVMILDVFSKTVKIRHIGRADSGLHGFLRIEIAHILHHGIGDERNGMVADHTPVFVGIMAPYGQHMMHALVVMGQHRFDHVVVPFRLNDVEQGMQRPVGVPERENSVVGEFVGSMDILVQPTVAAVHIFVNYRAKHGMVQGRVKSDHAGISHGFHLDFSQLFVPFFFGAGFCFFKIPVWYLRCEVFQSALRTYGRQSDFHAYLFPFLRIEIKERPDILSCHFRKIMVLIETSVKTRVCFLVVFFIAIAFKWFGKLQGKKHFAGPCPAAGLPIAGNQRVILNANERPYIFIIVIIHIVHHVQDKMCIIRCRKGVLMESHTLGGCQLGGDTIVIQKYPVIARRGLFFVVGKSRIKPFISRFGF